MVTLLSSTVGNAANLLVTAWLIRQLGSEDFGRVALLAGAASSLSSFSASGFALYAMRALSVGATAGAAGGTGMAGFAAATAGSQGLALLVSLPALLAAATIDSTWRWADVALAAVLLHGMTADAQYKSGLAGRQAVPALAQATLSGALALAALQITGTLLLGPQGLLLGWTLGAVAQALISRHLFRRTGHPWPAPDWRSSLRLLRSRDLRHFVAPATLAACLVPVAHWSVNALAAGKGSYADVATLAVAMQFFNVVLFIPMVMNKIVLPRTLQADRDDEAGSRVRALRQAAWMAGTLVAPLLVWLAWDLIAATYRFTQPQTLPVLLCFATSAAIACSLIPIGNLLVSRQRMWLGLLSNGVWAATYVGLAAVLPGAAAAAAQALLAAYAISLMLNLALALR